MPKTKSRAKNKKWCQYKVVPKKTVAPIVLCQKVVQKKSRVEKSRAEKNVVPKKKSRANRTVAPKKRVVPEKTNIVKKKLDEKNYVALTGLG